ncbi:MAG: polysaccharide export protein [Dechloromonas sp.]|nr:MAG: polysaccharide export protein [Dechloromonas sp.]
MAPLAAPPLSASKALPATGELDEYRLGPQDLIEISVFQVQELTRSVRVNAQGMITLPLLGQVRAGGLTANELEAVLTTKLSENLLQDPQVSVFVKEFVSQRVVIDGSVAKIGAYPLSGKTTLLQAIAMAGGLDPLADPTTVHVFRDRPSGQREVLTFDLLAIREGQAADPLIKGNDTITVEKSASKAFFKAATDTLRGFISFGQYRSASDFQPATGLLPGDLCDLSRPRA